MSCIPSPVPYHMTLQSENKTPITQIHIHICIRINQNTKLFSHEFSSEWKINLVPPQIILNECEYVCMVATINNPIKTGLAFALNFS